MDLNENQFSDIPALGDVEGLNNYMNNEQLKSLGIANQPTPQDIQPSNQPAAPVAGTNEPQPPQPQPLGNENQGQDPNPTVSRAEFDELVQTMKSIQASLGQRQAPQAQPAQRQASYTPQQLRFINEALARGYSMEQIMATLQQNSGQDAISKRVNDMENYLRQQRYEQAKTAFIDRMTEFGNKWGLSEQDLSTFGHAALKLGINVATVTDLEAVFRAVYPEQYAIRLQRMQNTPSSQIYGGTNMPESNRTMASRAEDAYVENFLAHTMPNMYNTSKK